MVDDKSDYRQKVIKFICYLSNLRFMLYFNLPSLKGIYIRGGGQQTEIWGRGQCFLPLLRVEGAEFVLTCSRRGRICFSWSGRGWVFFSDPG